MNGDAARRPGWTAPVALAALLAGAYVLCGLRSGDLAAHEFRAELFDREGFTLWNGQWYGGHHTPAYSVLFPPLAGLLGPKLVAAVSVVVATAIFARLEAEHFGDRARYASLWFGAGSVTLLLTGRLTFALGLAIGLGAVLAAGRDRTVATAALSVAAALGSPVAGAFLGLAGVAAFLVGRRGPGVALTVGGIAPVLALSWAFPEGGWQPFQFVTALPALVLAVVAVLVLPSRERALRAAAVLYAPAALGAYFIHTPMGSNVIRLYELLAVPLLLVFLASRPSGARRALALAAVVGFAYLQWHPAIRDVVRGIDNPSYDSAYYEPLLAYLEDQPPPGRIEIPPLQSHYEAVEVAPRFALARGWQRQLDVGRNELFYDDSLDETSYREWLDDNGVAVVAVSGAPLDFAGKDEERLLASTPSYLREVATPGDWIVYRVARPEDELELGVNSVAVELPRAGSRVLKVRWTPYWRVRGGCVSRAGDWTRVSARRAGRLVVGIEFDPQRLFEHGRRCG